MKDTGDNIDNMNVQLLFCRAVPVGVNSRGSQRRRHRSRFASLNVQLSPAEKSLFRRKPARDDEGENSWAMSLRHLRELYGKKSFLERTSRSSFL